MSGSRGVAPPSQPDRKRNCSYGDDGHFQNVRKVKARQENIIKIQFTS